MAHGRTKQTSRCRLVVLAGSSCRARTEISSLRILYLFAAISSCDIPVHPNDVLDVSLRVTVDETRGFTADNTHATVSSPLCLSIFLSLTLFTLFAAPVAYRLFSCTRVETDAGLLRRLDRYDEIARRDSPAPHVTGYRPRVNTYEILDTP